MATQTIDNRLAEVQGMMKTLLTTPIMQMTERERSILPLALTFADCFYQEQHGVELPEDNDRDLRGVHSATSLNHLCDMICVVDWYNNFKSTAICEVLEKHQDFINFEESSFGRQYSPVLYVGLKQSYLTGEFNFLEKANALAKDLIEVAKCDELHWSFAGKHEDWFVAPCESVKRWVPIYDNDNVVTGYEEITTDHFRKFRVWWD